MLKKFFNNRVDYYTSKDHETLLSLLKQSCYRKAASTQKENLATLKHISRKELIHNQAMKEFFNPPQVGQQNIVIP